MDLKEYTGVCYLHVPKCGGTYIENTLRPNLVRENKMFVPAGHSQTYPTRHSGAYGKLLPIATVRNPFDLLVSIYFHGGDVGIGRSAGFGYVNQVLDFKSFEEFVTYYCENGDYSKVPHILPLKDEFLFQPLLDNGNIIPDVVIKMEQLNQGCTSILQGFGIHRVDSTIDHNTSQYRPKGPEGDYKNFYTPKLKEMVEKRVKRDLELFNYTFEG
jgi:hypothetical protein|tara:strand:- start:2522 stop:3163 length:642 start_codon:yes stop_codon:yes gene_type:complete